MILVVGGAGYVGSHLVEQLRLSKIEHLVLDNLSQGHLKSVEGSNFVKGDLLDRKSLEGAFDSNPQIDTVINFAASISVGESVREPAKYWSNNFLGVFNLLEVMRQAGVKQFVFSSTAAIFGEPKTPALAEDHSKNPINPYGQTKLAVERMLEDYDVAYGLRSVCLRYFNASGASLTSNIGEDHTPEEHLIPIAIAAAMGKRAALKVFGQDYATPDGTCVRDYVHVSDLATAHVLAVEHLRKGGESRRYNLGNGRGYSVAEVIEAVSRIGGQTVPWEPADRRPGDPAVLVASSESIRKDWGWQPKFDLDQIVESAWNWHRRNPGGYPKE